VVDYEFGFVLECLHLLVVFIVVEHLFLVDEWLLARLFGFAVNCLFWFAVNCLFLFVGLMFFVVGVNWNEVAQCSLHLVVWMIRKG